MTAARPREPISALGARAAFGAALVAGGLVVLAFAPFDQPWVLWISFPTLVWLIDGAQRSARPGARSAAIGWAFGFGQFLAGLHWIGAAFLVNAEVFGWIMPVAIAALAAGLALFPMAATLIAQRLWRPGWRRVLILSLTWTEAEWLRGHVLTGFPWNMVGQAATAFDATLQAAALVGPDGLTLIIVLVAAMPALLGDGPARRASVHRPLIASGLLLAGLVLFGVWRLAQPDPPDVAAARLRIVQPDIPQTDKWDLAFQRQVFDILMTLSERPADPLGPPTHILWPEAATPFVLDRSPQALAAIGDLLGPGRLLLTGALRLEPDEAGDLRRVFNSLEVFDDQGSIRAVYDKAHLVPFGEYLPFRDLFAAVGLRAIAATLGEDTAGPGPMTLTVPGLPPFSPLICYENIFSGAVVAPGAVRPAWLLMVTNTAWFGRSIGPAQHFAQARMRAVEEGVPAIQVANAGISGVIDAKGRVRARLDLGARDILDATLPGALPPPPGARLPLWIGLAALVLGLAMTRRGRQVP